MDTIKFFLSTMYCYACNDDYTAALMHNNTSSRSVYPTSAIVYKLNLYSKWPHICTKVHNLPVMEDFRPSFNLHFKFLDNCPLCCLHEVWYRPKESLFSSYGSSGGPLSFMVVDGWGGQDDLPYYTIMVQLDLPNAVHVPSLYDT